MKLLGIEVLNYAGLSHQYIPISERVQILAGRNNIGKSALLHALAAFSGSERFKAYVNNGVLDIGFVFEAEAHELQNDFCFAFDFASNRRGIGGVYRVLTTFSRGGPSNPIKLIEVLPKGHSKWLHLGESEGDQFNRQYYMQDGNQFRRISTDRTYKFGAYFVSELLGFLNRTSYIDPIAK